MEGKRMLRISLNPALCKSCGICVALCQEKVLGLSAEKRPVVIDQGRCILCRQCEYHCPDFAIRVECEE